MKARFTDIHHHILCGMDDGAKNHKMMYAMLELAAKNGVSRIVATPHVTPGVQRFDRERYRKILDEANAYCQEKGLDMTLLEGGELLYTPHTCRFLNDGEVPTMAGTNRVLVEFSPDVKFDKLQDALIALSQSGYVPIIAHAERCRCLVMRTSRAESLRRELGVCYQINAGTIIKPMDLFEGHFVKKLLKMQMADAVASDAHNLTFRKVRMMEAYRILHREYGPQYARQLMNGSVLGK